MPPLTGWMLVKVTDKLVAPAMAPPLKYHWLFRGSLPAVVAVRVRLLEHWTVWFVGCVRMDG